MPGRVSRHKILAFAAVFYSSMALVACVWSWLSDGPWVLDMSAFDSMTWLNNVVLGLVLDLGLHLLTRSMTGRVKWSDELMTWFESELGRLSLVDALCLALLSGFGEELLFRGAMQASWGIGVTTILFALVHWPPDKRLRAWTWMAGIVGLIFGLLVEYRGSVVPAVAAHVGINFLNLAYIGRHPAKHQDET